MTFAYYKNNTHDRLRTVVLGSYYTPEYFEFITDSSIREPLQQISREINEDLDNFSSVLTSAGCWVLRPRLVPLEKFIDQYNKHQTLIPPPLQPRNYFSVVGNQLYQLNSPIASILECITEYNNTVVDISQSNQDFFKSSVSQSLSCYNGATDLWFKRKKYLELAGEDWPDFYDYVNGQRSSLPNIAKEMAQFESALVYETKEFRALQAPNIFPTDLGLVIDSNEYCDYATWFKEQSGFQGPVININTGAGHTDGCFTVLGRQTILGIDPLIDYSSSFPGYHVVGVPDQNYMNHINNFRIMESKVGGKWWVFGQELNNKFINFVETYLQGWTGYVYETVFDVNVLTLDEKTVCVSGIDQQLDHQLKQRGIECIYVPWRHRFFVDCGLHCLTLDLCRQS